jgi:DNA-binding NarL/FixJ family response regulator
MNPTLTNYIKTCDDKTLKEIRNVINSEYNKRGEKYARDEGKYQLTARQVDVLKLCCFEKKDIAKKLYITPSTVQTHYVDAYKNLLTNNKTEAIIKALKTGLIRLEEIELP